MPRQAIFFLIDTQGANCVGCYAGNPALGTVNIDALAARAVLFERAYTASPVCGPARSAIFTGLYPHSNGVLGNSMAPHADCPTIGQRLTGAGIRCGYVGKWHLDGTDYFGNGEAPPGWDPACWFDGRNYLDSLPDQAARDLSRQVLGPEKVKEHGITAEFTHAHRSADRAIEFIRAHRNEDFFLVVSIDEPHHPFICPEPFISSFDNFELPVGPAAFDTLEGKPRQQHEWSQSVEGWRRASTHVRDGQASVCVPAYFACNSYSDSEVGRVLAEIDRTVPGSLIIYTADHGDMFGAHQLMGKGPAVYDEICRVPLLIRWPGHAPEGARASGPVSHVDLVPTFLDFFGVAIPALLQGRSLLETVREPSKQKAEPIFIEFNRYELDHDGFGAFYPLRAIFDGRYKLAVNLLDTDELYDHSTDPAECRNLIDVAEHAAARARLHDALLDWMGRTRDPLRGPQWARRAWRDVSTSAFRGPTRPRPGDEAYFPTVLLYDTGRPVEKLVYSKS
jgi:uncharacterized sulfatase